MTASDTVYHRFVNLYQFTIFNLDCHPRTISFFCDLESHKANFIPTCVLGLYKILISIAIRASPILIPRILSNMQAYPQYLTQNDIPESGTTLDFPGFDISREMKKRTKKKIKDEHCLLPVWTWEGKEITFPRG